MEGCGCCDSVTIVDPTSLFTWQERAKGSFASSPRLVQEMQLPDRSAVFDTSQR